MGDAESRIGSPPALFHSLDSWNPARDLGPDAAILKWLPYAAGVDGAPLRCDGWTMILDYLSVCLSEIAPTMNELAAGFDRPTGLVR